MSTDPTPIISRICADGTILETVYDPETDTTALAVGAPDGSVSITPHFDLSDGSRLAPYSPKNNLLKTGCVLLPSDVGEVPDKADVIAAIRTYLARYVDLSSAFFDIVPYYVLLTWVYDAFNELPYLRFRGGYGTGKTRALLTIGSICNKPFFASGASTVSPIFHILDGFRGTLVLDEADFRFSDMTGQLTKILNNGTVNGLPVLRTMTNRHKELNPQAFRVFGPKILAMRGSFADPALESRLVTEETGRRPLAPHIPIHTPANLASEARELRNMLLGWRLRHRHEVAPDPARLLAGVSPRANQTALALLSLVDDEECRARIASHLGVAAQDEGASLANEPRVLILSALVEAFAASAKPHVPISEILDIFSRKTLGRFYHPVSSKWIGSTIRMQLHLKTVKSHGVYVVPQTERPTIEALAARYGIPTTAAQGVISPNDSDPASEMDVYEGAV